MFKNKVPRAIEKSYQKAVDYAEKKLNLPDMGVNALSAFNQHMLESSAAEAKYYAENASRGKIASKLNQYGPDVVALLPEIVLAAISGGTTAVAGTGVRALNTVSKLDNMSDAMKIAGKWLKDNPTAALNFLQASVDAHKQALS